MVKASFCETGIKFVQSRLRCCSWASRRAPANRQHTDVSCCRDSHRTNPPEGPVKSARQQLMLKCMLWHTGLVIYHASQSLWIDWNKINVVQGLTASVYRVVSAALLDAA